MTTWFLTTLLIAMVVVWMEKRRSVSENHRATWCVAILARRIEEQWNACAVAPAFDERFAMLINAAWTAHKNKRRSHAIEETKPLIFEAPERGIDHPQCRAMTSSVTSRRRRAHTRCRTARGPPSVVGEDVRGRDDNP